MATSISKAQADALADGFFDNIGSKEDFKPEHTLSGLYQLAGGLVNEAVDNLNKADRVASGALSDSIRVLNPEMVSGRVQIDIELLYYYKFVDEGVKGTKGGSGKYSFKNPYPGKNMVKALRKWLTKEGLKSRTNTGGKPVSKREARRKSITDATTSAAYGIARSIKMKGLKKTNFFSKAIKATDSKSKEVLQKGFRLDIIDSLPKNIG